MQNLEKRKLVIEYAFDHYFSNLNEPDELRVRFQYTEEKNREAVERELEREVKKSFGRLCQERTDLGFSRTYTKSI